MENEKINSACEKATRTRRRKMKYLKFEINGHMFHWPIDFDEDGFFHLHLDAISSDTDCGWVVESRDILDIDDENLFFKNGDVIPYEVEKGGEE